MFKILYYQDVHLHNIYTKFPIINKRIRLWSQWHRHQLSHYTVRPQCPPVNLTMDSCRVLYGDYHATSRFFTTRQSFAILSVKTTKKAILTYFRVPLDIKQQYLKSKYFVDVIENSFLFDFQITTYFSLNYNSSYN